MARNSKRLRNFKEVKKNAVPVIINSAITGVSFLGAKAATNKLADKIENENLRKIVGPAKVILGMAMEAFIEHPNIAAIGRGVAVSGFDTTANDLLPDSMKEKIGLGNTVNAIDASPNDEFDWEAAAQEAEEEMNVSEEEAAADDEPVNGTPVGDMVSSAVL